MPLVESNIMFCFLIDMAQWGGGYCKESGDLLEGSPTAGNPGLSCFYCLRAARLDPSYFTKNQMNKTHLRVETKQNS